MRNRGYFDNFVHMCEKNIHGKKWSNQYNEIKSRK